MTILTERLYFTLVTQRGAGHYLVLENQGSPKDAFAALRMSDLVSPNEPRQQVERALMWHRLRDVEDASQQAYQADLWQKAFTLQPGLMVREARMRGLVDEIAVALKQKDPSLYEYWLRSEGRAPKEN